MGMPRFYFDFVDGRETGEDAEGIDLPDLTAARESALETLGEIAKDELPDGDHREFAITIREEGGKPLIRATLSLQVERLD